MDNIRVPTFKRKKVTAITVTAVKPTVGKLLIALSNMILEGERRDGQDVNMRKI